MNFIHWLRSALTPPPRRLRPATRRLTVERLEDRLTPTAGLLDPTFGAGTGYVLSSVANQANAVAVQWNGQIVIAGTATSSGKNPVGEFLVARYNVDGSPDTSFGSGGYSVTAFNKSFGMTPEAVAIQSDGKILAAGYAYMNGADSYALARYNANGTLDTTFGNKGEVLTATGGMAFSMAVQTDGRIVVLGDNGGGYATLARYNTNGKLDTTFGKGGELVTTIYTNDAPTYSSLLIQPIDGKIVITGPTKDPTSGFGGFMVARFNANGTADASFGNGGEVITHVAGSSADSSSSIALQADGKIVVNGAAQFPSLGTSDLCLIRYNADGTLDTTFGSSGNGIVMVPAPAGFSSVNFGRGVEIQSDGKIVAGGNIVSSTGGTTGVLRMNPDGSVDTSYGNAGWATVQIGSSGLQYAYGSALQPDGRLLLLGKAGTAVALVRLLPSEPEIGAFTANPSPVASGSSTTLTASNISDGNPISTIAQVTFYYFDANGNKAVLGYGTADGSGDWLLNFSVNLASGTYTLYAQAEDNYGVLGDPDTLTLTVQ